MDADSWPYDYAPITILSWFVRHLSERCAELPRRRQLFVCLVAVAFLKCRGRVPWTSSAPSF